MNNYYNKNLQKFASELRTETVSRAEKLLWKASLARTQMGFKFKRQRPILNFIVDFFCAELNLIIEIDGNSHLCNGSYDFYRQEKLMSLGYTIIRFQEGEVLNNLHEVDNSIRHTIYVLKERNKNS
jgi:very-short-patch-repair endonuclease